MPSWMEMDLDEAPVNLRLTDLVTATPKKGSNRDARRMLIFAPLTLQLAL